MKVNNKVYDVMKWIVTIIIPAIITLYSSLASIWGIPYSEQIIATLAAIDIFLGVIMKISSKEYSKNLDGILYIDKDGDDETNRYLFSIDDLDVVDQKDQITIKIKNKIPDEEWEDA